MAKVKVCLDDACIRYYELDDGRAVAIAKDKCEIEKFAKNPKSLADFKQRFTTMMRNTKKVISMSDDPEWKAGDDAML